MELKRALFAVCATITSALLSVAPSLAESGQVVVATGGGSYLDALRESTFKPFEKATGIKVIETVGPTLPKIRAMVDAGNPEWDVVELAPADYQVLVSHGMLQQIDYTAMDQTVFADFPKETIESFGVGTVVFAKVIAFNTKKYTQANAPKSWADVWDTKKFPGPRILDAGNGVIPPIEFALLADGVSPEHLYPLDFKRAYASLSRIKPSVVKWATTSAMEPEALISGEAVIGAAPNARIQLAKEQGAPVDYVWNEALTGYSSYGILKGSKNVKNALKYIEFASRPEIQAALATRFLAGPLNKKAVELIPVDRAKLLPSYPENKAKTVASNPAWWAEKDTSGKSNVEINDLLWNTWITQQ